jgi:hypothetical protein
MRYSCRSALRSSIRRNGRHVARRAGIVGLLLGIAVIVLTPSAGRAGDIAVVVNPDVKVENLSFSELRKILLGDRQFWPTGQPVTLIVRAPVAAERTFLLEKVYDMTDAQFRQYWIAKVFRAEATSGPKVVVSNSESMELVGVLSGAIVLMDAKDVPAGLKVLQVDKLRPGDKGYPLKPVPASE